MSTDDLVYGSITCVAIGLPILAALHTLLWLERHWASVGAKLLVAVVLLVVGMNDHYDHGYIDLSPIIFTLGTLAATAGVAELAKLSWWQRPLLIVGGTLLVALPLWIIPVWKERERRAQLPATSLRVDDHHRRIAG